MLDATKTNICFFMHAVFESAEKYGVPVTANHITAVTEAAIDAALLEEKLQAHENGVYENPEAMYTKGQNWASANGY